MAERSFIRLLISTTSRQCHVLVLLAVRHVSFHIYFIRLIVFFTHISIFNIEFKYICFQFHLEMSYSFIILFHLLDIVLVVLLSHYRFL